MAARMSVQVEFDDEPAWQQGDPSGMATDFQHSEVYKRRGPHQNALETKQTTSFLD